MKHAVFLQASLTNGLVGQVLVIPTSPVRTFFRVAAVGARGRAARWEDITGLEATRLSPITTARLDREPLAVRFTEADERQVIERGIPTTLGTKAMTALDRRPTSSATIGDVFDNGALLDHVAAQDPVVIGWASLVASAPVRTAAPPVPVATPPAVTPTTADVHTVNAPVMGMASVPPREIAKRYVHRKVYGQDDFAIYEYAQQTKANVLIKGPTGAAKTMSALAYAASKGLPTFTISGSVNFEVSEAIGQLMINPDGSMYFQYGGAVEVIRDGGVLILDEINFIPGKVITPLFPLLDDRREIVLKQNKGEVIKAHPDLIIVATMNPGYLGTQQLNAALANRFDIQLTWEYDEAVEKQLVPSKALRELAAQLREAEVAKRLFTPTPTNALMDVVAHTKALGLDFALANFLARYDESEQASVKLALDTHRNNIESDLGVAPTASVDSDEIEVPLAEWEKELIDPSVTATVSPWQPNNP